MTAGSTASTATATPATADTRPLWDLFCRVIDNHGDLGVCWRLARQLVARGQQVRLWVDDARALAWMAPARSDSPMLSVLPWPGADAPADTLPEPGAVVVEAFGCDPPAAFVACIAAAARPPVWINLEYLSAEPYVERSHRLRSPQRCGVDKWFFYPGFSPATGGLLRETDLLQRQQAFQAESCEAWLAGHGIVRRPGEWLISLFCYPDAGLQALIDALAAADQPALLLCTPGAATAQVAAITKDAGLPAGVRSTALAWLSQDDYDALLWCCDLNAVRGEDSCVRAIWAGRPLLWQIYPQADGVHAGKLAAYLDRQAQAASAAEPLAAMTRAWMLAWNRLGPAPPALPPLAEWRAQALAWRDSLLGQRDLVDQLLEFVAERR